MVLLGRECHRVNPDGGLQQIVVTCLVAIDVHLERSQPDSRKCLGPDFRCQL